MQQPIIDAMSLIEDRDNILDLDSLDEYILENGILDLTSIEELLSNKQITRHTNTSRLGLHARRLGRIVAAAIIPLGAVIASLSELGIIPTTEKHAFIRFQGMVTIHAGRVDKSLGGNKVKSRIDEIRSKAQVALSGVKPDDAKTLSTIYVKMLSTELASIINGYITIMTKAGADPSFVKILTSNLSSLSTNVIEGTGVWNRIKSHFGGGIIAAIFPVMSLIKQFEILDKKNPQLKLKPTAQKLIKS